MLKRFTKALVVLIALGLLQACASLPMGGAQPGATIPKVDPQVQANYQRALGLMQEGQLKPALDLLQRVAAQDKRLAGPWVNMSIIQRKLGHADEALKAVQQAITANPGNPAALNQLGILQREAGQFEQASASYERALTVRPDYSYAHLNKGILCDLYLRNIACALQHYQKYQDLAGEDKQVKLWIADLKRRQAAKP